MFHRKYKINNMLGTRICKWKERQSNDHCYIVMYVSR